jgi:hypothetical protein
MVSNAFSSTEPQSYTPPTGAGGGVPGGFIFSTSIPFAIGVGAVVMMIDGEAVAVAWHHLAAKKVFDPADKKSLLTQRGLSLAADIDIHSREYGLNVPLEVHSSELHSNNNVTRMTWQKVQENKLNAWIKENPHRAVISKADLNAIINETMKDFKMLDGNGQVLERYGKRSTTTYPGLRGHYGKLAQSGFFSTARLIPTKATHPTALPLEVLEKLKPVELQKLASRTKGAWSLTAKMVGGGVVLFSLASSVAEARAAAADGAPGAAAAAVGVIELVNPTPWSVMEIKGTMEDYQDLADYKLGAMRQGIILRRLNDANVNDPDMRKNMLPE